MHVNSTHQNRGKIKSVKFKMKLSEVQLLSLCVTFHTLRVFYK